MIYKKLKDLKEKSKKTNHEIAELSGIPESTVTRIFSGHTDNPSFQTICDIVLALDGSLDEFVGNNCPKHDERHFESGACKKCEKHIDTINSHYRTEIERKDKCVSRLFLLCIVLCGIITLLSIALVVHGMSI